MVSDLQGVLALGPLPPAAHSGEGPVHVARGIAADRQETNRLRIKTHTGSFSLLVRAVVSGAAFNSSVCTISFSAKMFVDTFNPLKF